MLKYGRAREAFTVSLTAESARCVHLIQVEAHIIIARCGIKVVQVSHLLMLLQLGAVELGRLVRQLLIKLWHLAVHARNAYWSRQLPRRIILIGHLVEGKGGRAVVLR